MVGIPWSKVIALFFGLEHLLATSQAFSRSCRISCRCNLVLLVAQDAVSRALLCHHMSKMISLGNFFDFLKSFVLFFAVLGETIASAKMSYSRILLHVRAVSIHVCKTTLSVQPLSWRVHSFSWYNCVRHTDLIVVALVVGSSSPGYFSHIFAETALYFHGGVGPCFVNPFPTGPNTLFLQTFCSFGSFLSRFFWHWRVHSFSRYRAGGPWLARGKLTGEV